MRNPELGETPLSFEEMVIGWQRRVFAKPGEPPDDIDEWPVVQRHKAAGTWSLPTTNKTLRGVWDGLL